MQNNCFSLNFMDALQEKLCNVSKKPDTFWKHHRYYIAFQGSTTALLPQQRLFSTRLN